MGPSPAPQVAGSSILRLATGPESVGGAYVPTADGLQPMHDPWANTGTASQLLAKSADETSARWKGRSLLDGTRIFCRH